MSPDHIARSTVVIAAPADRVWCALVTPAAIREYMFGTTVISDWKIGDPIVWKGEWQGREYEDRGKIVRFEPERALAYTHFSPLSGRPDTPEHHHTVTIELAAEGKGTRVSLTQDHNTSRKEREHAEKTWTMMLNALKRFVEHSK